MLYQSDAIAPPADRSVLRPVVILFLSGQLFGLVRPSPCWFVRHLLRRAALPRTVIIDTDAGSDDLMAIAFLLSRPDIRSGSHHDRERHGACAGRRRKCLAVTGTGRAQGCSRFPWAGAPLSGDRGVSRRMATQSRMNFPESSYRMPRREPRISQRGRLSLQAACRCMRIPCRCLPLGPLTNLAEVFTRTPRDGPQGFVN